MKKVLFCLVLSTMLMSATCVRDKAESQEIMSDETEKQTKLLEEQVKQLTRIANALERDTTRWHPYIIKSKP